RFKVRIFATDIDEEAIAFARRGIYAHSALADVSEDLINRYFVKEDGDYQVNKLIRGMVIFGQHDLAQRAPFPNTDMVVCRNVLIYFTTALQKRALQLFAYSLRDDGRLVLGKAESTSPLSEFFVSEDRQRKIYRRRGDRFLMPPALLENPVPISPKISPPPGGNTARVPGPVQQTGRDQQQAGRLLNNLLLKLPVGMVAVNRRYDIQFINNVARRLLSIHSPATGEDLIHLVQGAAYTKLRSAIDAAFREDDPVEVDELAVEEPDTGESRYLRMVIRAQSTADAREPSETVMIFIQDITNLARTRSDLAQRLQSVTAELEQEKLLNQRLAQTNRQLDEGNQELTRINEDLQTANEELLLSTEEAQASTEEVETLNEELQATNEELETLNEELQATIEELNTTTDDLQARSLELQSLAQEGEREQARLEAILDSMDIAVLVVDAAGQDAFANTAYQRMFGESGLVCLDESGEPLPDREAPRHRATREELFSVQFSAKTKDGAQRRFEVTGAPLRDDANGRQGGVILIRDVTE
ncbi:MAG TPA: CheR family methyltransferase, partial [Rubrobacteraceae bacterium]|nr:CheR family methyltransferase [Rubrobacteraceae bacterium]